MKSIYLHLSVLVSSVLLCACGSGSSAQPTHSVPEFHPSDYAGLTNVTVTKEQLNAAWPLTVSSVNLSCEGGTKLLATADGKKYALNDAAIRDGTPSIDAVRRQGASLGALIGRASSLCANTR
ncbi:MAG: hypothetical protein QG608_1603 [Actinomycetota bacterium]|nr:hypothetical protein [Actinomycetota bacterium]